MGNPQDHDDSVIQRREQWHNRGQSRPAFALAPGQNQESVWDYPRPPVIEENYKPILVTSGEQEIARSAAGFRVLETAGAPTYYLPPDDVSLADLVSIEQRSFCEWKGEARYWALAQDPTQQAVAWSYPAPFDAFLPIADCIAFYPTQMRCWLDGERVAPQPGGFYGGWVTSQIIGPFKGEPGTENW